jgi:translation elongation factor EF-4
VPGPPRLAEGAHLRRLARDGEIRSAAQRRSCSTFYDRLKSVSKGYASFDYHLTDYKPADLVKMQILVNSEPVDALSMLVHRTRAEGRGRAMVEKMKELIPPHMFQIPIQARSAAR